MIAEWATCVPFCATEISSTSFVPAVVIEVVSRTSAEIVGAPVYVIRLLDETVMSEDARIDVVVPAAFVGVDAPLIVVAADDEM